MTKANLMQSLDRSIKCLLVTLVIVASAQGQIPDPDVFRPVPVALRSRLVERLRLLIEYQGGQQWENQYEILSALVTQGESKEDHVKRLERLYAERLTDVLLDFTPKSVSYRGGGPSDVVIFGCAKLGTAGTVKEFYASVEAYREKGDWYFSPVGVITPIDGKPKPCPYAVNALSRSP